MTRPPQSCSVVAEERDQGLKKGPWTPDEDQKLVAYIQQHGHGSWRSLPVHAGLQRCGKSCRLRWTNYLRPDIKRGRFSQEEDRMIVHLHAILGNRWSAIASHLPRRTDNEIKNYWNTHLKKRLLQMGIDPVTHKPTSPSSEDLDSTNILSRPVVSSTLSHMSQWECARAEAEARLSRQSSTVRQQGITTLQGDASTSFMSSWKAQVAETLRPSFGVVELEKLHTTPTANMQTFLHDWEFSTSRQPVTFAAYDSPVEFPDFASSGTVSPQYVDDVPAASHALPSSAQITERLLASRGSFHNDVESLVLSKFSPSFIDNVSPTSTLQGPDHHYDSSNSPSCVSSSTGDSFDLLAHTLGLIHHESENSQARTTSMFQPAAEPHFWQPPPSDSYIFLSKSSLTNNLTQVAVPNNIPIPQFDFLS